METRPADDKGQKMSSNSKLKLALSQMKIGPAFSGVILIKNERETLFELAQGYAHLAEKIPNRMATRFQTASGCKGFTALAIMQLVEKSLLHLEGRLKDLVEANFPTFSDDITVEHLLTHTSGITSYFEEDINPDYEALWEDVPMYHIRRPADFLPLFQNKAQKFPPGDHFEYNDGGFILLGLIIETVSGMPFTDYVQSKILSPAGMNRSGYFYTDQLPEGCALAYVKEDDKTWRTNTFAVPIIGGSDGGAYVTAPDMDRFWHSLIKGDLLDKTLLKSMLSPQLKAEEAKYGLGFWIEDGTEGILPYLEGWDPGVSMLSVMMPAESTTITLLANKNGAVWRIYDDVRKILRQY
jgi:CubicO group peptidase (beta-lactamase class C family)